MPPAPDPSTHTHQWPCSDSKASYVFVTSNSFLCQVGLIWGRRGLADTSQAASEVSLFGVDSFCAGSWDTFDASLPPWSTSPPRRIDRILLFQLGLRVRRLSLPTAPSPAASPTWPAAEPHTLRAQAMQPCFPPPPPLFSLALPPRPRAHTFALLAAWRNYLRRPPSATAQRSAPPWPQIMILGIMGIPISRIIRCDAVFLVGFSFSLSILG